VAKKQPKKRSNAGSRRTRLATAVALRRDIARLAHELRQAERKIAELEARADVDPLTEILNRRGFEREFKRSLAYIARYGASAGLVYIDLDGFKAINDRHGHAAGDALLKAVARALTRHVRASDLVARLGGDEFAVLLWNASEAHAQAKARALEEAIAAAGVGASAGIVALTGDITAAQALAAADKAMYARKARAPLANKAPARTATRKKPRR